MPDLRYRLDESVRDLPVSYQVVNVLERAKVMLIEDLLRCSPHDLLLLRGIGLTRLMEIRLALGGRGLGLADDPQTEYFIDEAAALAR